MHYPPSEELQPRDLPIAACMHEVDNHIVWLAAYVLFTGTVKVKLCKLVTLISRNQNISAIRSIMVVHADCFTIIY